MAILNRFFISVVLPSILAIALFIVAIFAFILPSFEKNIMEGKKEMISELTNSVCSLIEEYQLEMEAGLLSADSAKALALDRVQRIRYGDEEKDYFWIIDRTPVMLMHPYRPELTGSKLNYYQDPDGKLLFVESVRTVEKDGEGFIDYRWQWKDDSTRIVTKLSFVKGIPRWNWIVGTGIYLEDVRGEIQSLKARLLRIALIITLIISIILGFIIRQSLRIERLRRKAETQLRLSREKYKTLVEASTEGTLMQEAGTLIFSNRKFSALSGYDSEEIGRLGFGGLFEQPWSLFENAFDDPEKSVSREATLLCKDGQSRDVVLSASRVRHGNKDAYILIVKEVSPHMQYEQEASMLNIEMQHMLAWIKQPVQSLGREIISCPGSLAIRDAAALMARKKCEVLFIRIEDEIVGQINNEDLGERVLSQGLETTRNLMQVMTAPVLRLSEDALLPEALLLMKEHMRSHLLLVNAEGKETGVLSYKELVLLQENKLDILLLEIGKAEGIVQLKKLYARLPVLVSALLESGSRSRALMRLISQVADAIHRRVLELGLERMGEAPLPFAFMVLGSQGRQEQSLATDQDNALLIDDRNGTPGEKERKWFLELGHWINERLDEIGYIRCEGDIMAGNPVWNAPLRAWKKHFSDWFRDSDPQSVLDTAIFFDFRFIYGEPDLVSELRKHVEDQARHKAVFLYHMAQSVQKFRIPSQGAEVHVKRLLMPLQAYLRILSLREGIAATNSFERASMLKEQKQLKSEEYADLMDNLEYLGHLRIRIQARAISTSEKPGNSIPSESLSQLDKHILKKVTSDIQGLQTRLGTAFNS